MRMKEKLRDASGNALLVKSITALQAENARLKESNQAVLARNRAVRQAGEALIDLLACRGLDLTPSIAEKIAEWDTAKQ